VPRNFAIDPSGEFLLAANQNTSNLVLFRLDPAQGSPIPTGVEAAVPSPVCVLFFDL
jgi:6-phosphogluconolactonase